MPRPWSRHAARPERASEAEPLERLQERPAKETDPWLHEILDRMSEGVLVVSPELRPLLANTSARNLLGIRSEELPQRIPNEELVELAMQARDEDHGTETTLKLFFPTESILQVRAAPMHDREILITLRDVTQEVLGQRVRKEFVAHASHELKSPVASMQALAEAVHKALEDDPAAAQRFSERLVAESERLGRLLNDLLDLSRLEEAGVRPSDTVDLAAVARAEVNEAHAEAAEKGIDVVARLDDGVRVRGDEQQLALLLRNLLENAIRYTPADGHVSVEVSTTDSEAIVAVTDDGIGIAREAQARVFERFYRIDRARSRDRGGTGLGLAIVKHVAELHGGRVDVKSELGEGSTFTAYLPLLAEQIRSIA